MLRLAPPPRSGRRKWYSLEQTESGDSCMARLRRNSVLYNSRAAGKATGTSPGLVWCLSLPQHNFARRRRAGSPG
jgi:hypothetical protein